MNIPHIVLSFLFGVSMMTVALIGQNYVAEAGCAKQYNVYSCARVTVMMPRGAR